MWPLCGVLAGGCGAWRLLARRRRRRRHSVPIPLLGLKIDNIHKIHAPKIQGRVFSEVAEAPQAATTSRTARGETPKPDMLTKFRQLFDKSRQQFDNNKNRRFSFVGFWSRGNDYRDSLGHSYLIVRNENLRFVQHGLLRKHWPRMFSLIKNES